MIKAVVSNPTTGDRMAVLGLSGENMARLMAGEPMLVNLAELGLPPQRVALVGGHTEADIERDLRGTFTDRTSANTKGDVKP